MQTPTVRSIIVLITFLSLGACSTQATKQYQAKVTAEKEMLQTYADCKDAAKDEKVHQRLSERFIVADKDPEAVKKILITGYATEQEKLDLVDALGSTNHCRNNLLAAYVQHLPQFSTLMVEYFNKNELDTIKIAKDEFTVGEYNQRMKERKARVLARYGEIANEVTESYETARKQELAAMSESINQSVQQQQQQQKQEEERRQQWYQQQRGITQTNCTQYGNSINCTHY